MNIQLRTEKGKNLASKNGAVIPENLLQRQHNGAEHTYHSSSLGNILLQELVIDGFIIGHHIFIMEKASKVRLSYKEPCAVLQYMLDGNNCTLLSSGKETTSMSDSSFLYHAFRGQEMLLRLDKGEQHFFQIQFPLSLLKKIPFQGEMYRLEQDLDQTFFVGPVDINKRILFIINRTIHYASESPLPVFVLNFRCLDLLRQFVKDLASSQKILQWIGHKQPELDRLKDDILSNLSDPVLLRSMLPALIRKMSVSIYQFNKISKKVFGMTMPAFIKEKRMERAMQLLTGTDTSIGEIGMLVGYEEFSTFSRAFTKHYGNPPSYYRR